MMTATNDLDDRERRLLTALADYYRESEAGRVSERRALFEEHPDLADDLEAFFDDHDAIQGLTAPLREVARAAHIPIDVAAPCGLEGDLGPGEIAGRQFADYVLLGEIAHGGMGVVYEARQISLNRRVALKMILSGEVASAADVKRFQAEAVAHLDHPNIVSVYEVGEYQGRQSFSMKRIEGESLAGHLERLSLEPRVSARLVATAARAVHHAHQRGILHRDLKPSNILLDAEGQPHVTDFGLAKRVEVDSELTQSGARPGSPPYMAPEQAMGRRGAITTATDVHGLGAVLYALLTGRPPFRGDSVLDTIEHVRDRPPEPPSGINRRVDRDLQTVCLKYLEKDPQRRYESAREQAEDLERWLRGESITARPSGALRRLHLWSRRPARVRDAGIVAILVGLVMTAYASAGLLMLYLGVIPAERPSALAFHALLSIGQVYVPLIITGCETILRPAWAIWAGMALALFRLVISTAFLFGSNLGIDSGGAFNDKDPSLRIAFYLMLVSTPLLVTMSYMIVIHAHYVNAETSIQSRTVSNN